MDILIYIFPIAFVILVIFAAVFGLLIGKHKFNKNHNIGKEKKIKTVKSESEKKTRHSENAVAASSFSDEIETEEDYGRAVKSLKEEKAGKTSQKIIEGPVIIIDENKVNNEEVIEWKPPAEDKLETKPEIKGDENPASKEAISTHTVVSSDISLSEEEWNDEDLEIFEARAYSFEEEKNGSPNTPASQNQDVVLEETDTFRARKEQIYNSADDEGVQVFETKEEKPEPEPFPKEEVKVSTSKYAYFDSVMENEKTAAPVKTESSALLERKESEPLLERKESDSVPASKKKSGMQYIELELDDNE